MRPANAAHGLLPVILYVHDLGWIFGGAETHDRLVRELADGVQAAVVFPNYEGTRGQVPTRIEQIHAVANWITMNGPECSLDTTRVAVAGDSLGGSMATVTTMLAKQRGGVQFQAQLLYYPVTNAAFDTASYTQLLYPAPIRVLPLPGGHEVVLGPVHDRSGQRAEITLHRCEPRPRTSPACLRQWSSWVRRTCCATRARPTRRICAPRACRLRRSATPA